ncbi:MAG: outer membrane lipoprotein carrier protein LolA [Desulfobacterales bacterium]|nr:outer membrane lipoprotein carrier protein LolA [Desulfobacterales bacterium]
MRPRVPVLLFRLALFFLVVLGLPLRGAGQDRLDAESVARHIQKNYETAQGMSADFTQVTTLKLSRRQRQGSGRVILRKPGLMRWDYFSPDRQVLISNGTTLTMYFEKSHQLITSPAREYLQSDVIYGFFTGSGDILRDFIVSFADGARFARDTTYLLKLIPRQPQPQVAQLYLWVDAPDFLIQRIRIIDHFNTVTDISFSNISMHTVGDDQGIDPGLFKFSPPPDTEIINQ